LGPSPARRRIGEARDDVEKLDDRTRPAVHEEERKRVGARGARVDEMDRLTVDGCTEVLEAVEGRLLGSPVVTRAPVVDEFVQIVDRDAVLPVGALDLVGETRVREARLQVRQHGIVDV
jgi:hypothetical protein